MTDRPILFSGAMVRAILEDRKSQTRRIVKPQPFATNSYHRGDIQAQENVIRSTGDPVCFNFGVTAVDGDGGLFETIECPYGCPGDRLWVRERARVIAKAGFKCFVNGPHIVQRIRLCYEADGTDSHVIDYPDRLAAIKVGRCIPNGCFREASRITLEIAGIRVERLNEISEVDAQAEGCAPAWLDVGGDRVHHSSPPSYRRGFARLWNTINGPGSWDANPWVWVIEFKRVAP